MIKQFFSGKNDEIYSLQNAIKRTTKEIDRINSEFDPSKDCCTTCKTGGYDLVLDRKLHRQIVRLRVLYQRKGRTKDIEALENEFGKDDIDTWQKNNGNWR